MFLLKLFCNVPEGSGSWKYDMYFPADEVARKTGGSLQEGLSALRINRVLNYRFNINNVCDLELNSVEIFCQRMKVRSTGLIF